jgi:LysR family transcriptional regulator, nitrogen assimilation regulatory protein
MDLKQLRALLAIAETGSVTRAAESLHLVQPAITRQLKLLEEELGVPLFDRERHGMVLTPAGRRFSDSVRRALDELDNAKADISPRSQKVAGTVVVGLFPSAGEQLVGRLLAKVRRNFPLVQVRSYITYLPYLEQSLERGDVDVALVYVDDEANARFQREALLEDSLYLVGPPDADLDMSTPTPLSSLAELPLVLPARSSVVRRMVERECAAQGVTLNLTAEADATNVQKALAMSGEALTILSGFVIAGDIESGLLSGSPLASTGLRRTLYLARAAGKPLTPASACVMDELRDLVRQWVTQGRWPGGTLIG